MDGAAVRMVTVLAPGATYTEANKKFCTRVGSDSRYDASFSTLGTASPEEPPKAPVARAKPSIAAPQPTAADVAVAAVEPSVPMPRAKPTPPPAYPPRPRAKPEAPVATVAAAPAMAIDTTGAFEPSPAEPSLDACGDDCPPILFKVIDECVWVLNLNPRPVAFVAETGGGRTALRLEAADGAKADAAAAGKGAASEGALHMRLKDPFQSAGTGIPVFRARLGPRGACVKSRTEITRFSANYTR
jgi:outer membrane biosynthesis protein TonB